MPKTVDDVASIASSDVASSIASSGAASGLSSNASSSDAASVAISYASGETSGSKAEAAKLLRKLETSWFFRRYCFDIVQSTRINNIILGIIIINTVVMALQTINSLNKPYGYYFSILDHIFLGVYIIEAALKLFVWGFQYFKSGWNSFDFFIVITSIITWVLPVLLQATLQFNTQIFRLLRLFRAVRAVRTLRVLRTISFLKSLQIIVTTILKSIPALANILALTGLVLYIFAVIARSQYGDIDPRRFGNLGACLFRLFGLMTLDNWSFIWLDNRYEAGSIWAFCAVFIVIETFVFLNLFVAIIINSLDESRERMRKSTKKAKRAAKADEDLAADPNASPIQERAEDIKTALSEVFTDGLGLENFYNTTMPSRQRELIGKYFQLLASLEHNMSFYFTQQKVLDELVDLVKEHADKQNEFNPNEAEKP